MSEPLRFFHNPTSRGGIIHWMLEEVGVPYEMQILDLKKAEQKHPSYLAINPMGKVPAIQHRGVVVTESAAICAYLADAFPEAGLAPGVSDPQRGTYYRWLFFGAGCIEAAWMEKILSLPNTKSSASGYGSYEDTVNTLEKALQPGPFILGSQFSAADVYIASQISWGFMVKILEPREIFKTYLKACMARPGFQRFSAQSKELIKNMNRTPAEG